jgi:hypothetical protein
VAALLEQALEAAEGLAGQLAQLGAAPYAALARCPWGLPQLPQAALDSLQAAVGAALAGLSTATAAGVAGGGPGSSAGGASGSGGGGERAGLLGAASGLVALAVRLHQQRVASGPLPQLEGLLAQLHTAVVRALRHCKAQQARGGPQALELQTRLLDLLPHVCGAALRELAEAEQGSIGGASSSSSSSSAPVALQLLVLLVADALPAADWLPVLQQQVDPSRVLAAAAQQVPRLMEQVGDWGLAGGLAGGWQGGWQGGCCVLHMLRWCSCPRLLDDACLPACTHARTHAMPCMPPARRCNLAARCCPPADALARLPATRPPPAPGPSRWQAARPQLPRPQWWP